MSKDPTLTIFEEDDHGSGKIVFELITKDFIAEQILTESKQTRTWRLIKMPSGKDVVVEFLFHDHADGDEDWQWGYDQQSWTSLKSKEGVNKFLSENLDKHHGWSVSGSLEVQKSPED